MSGSLISIILPVHNQADHIAKIIQEYTNALAKVPNPHEFWLIANACKDKTVEVCEQLSKEFKTVNYLVTDNGGWGLAVKLGLAKANGDIICYTNSARTSPEILSLTVLYAVVYPNVVIKANRKLIRVLLHRGHGLVGSIRAICRRNEAQQVDCYRIHAGCGNHTCAEH